MNTLAELAIALLELLEAEGRAFRQSLIRTGMGLGLVVIAVILSIGGFGLSLWSGYLYLSTMLEPPLAALTTGGLAFALAAILLFIALRFGR
ncbi:MAG: hypothetical protein DRQ54_09760 [Gammaproteobacteria bacterium]|nr:MAG: hypothetical protein DRQ54_09760 [Gammaproteobacteria bacterium]RLA15364.1 MAG: hypothetical protein DRQ52_01920 [Gammaproteobacteria bacterium]